MRIRVAAASGRGPAVDIAKASVGGSIADELTGIGARP
jgi:hypothetical protein